MSATPSAAEQHAEADGSSPTFISCQPSLRPAPQLFASVRFAGAASWLRGPQIAWTGL